MTETPNLHLTKDAESGELYSVARVNANSDRIDAYCYQTRQNTVNNAAEITELQSSKQNVLSWDAAPIENSTNPVTSGGLYAILSAIDTLHKAVTLETGADLNDLYIDQSPTNADCVTRKWVIPSATVGASLLHLPASYKTVYANCEIEWHTVKSGGVGYQIMTAGTNSSFQRFMRFRNASGWTGWYTVFDTDNA